MLKNSRSIYSFYILSIMHFNRRHITSVFYQKYSKNLLNFTPHLGMSAFRCPLLAVIDGRTLAPNTSRVTSRIACPPAVALAQLHAVYCTRHHHRLIVLSSCSLLCSLHFTIILLCRPCKFNLSHVIFSVNPSPSFIFLSFSHSLIQYINTSIHQSINPSISIFHI